MVAALSVSASTSQALSWARSPKAFRDASSSLAAHELQGACVRHSLPQGRGVLPHQFNPADFLPGGQLGVERIVALPRFYSSRRDGSRRPAAHTLPVEQILQSCADRYLQHRPRPFLRTSSAGFKTSQKVTQGHGNRTHVRGFTTQGSAGND